MTRILTIAWTVWLEMLRKKDIYVLLILLVLLLFTLLSVDIFGLGGVVGYVKDIGLLFTWLFAWILAVTITARELPAEERKGTIYPLLAKPITRLELVLGKWLGAWSIVTTATLLFYVAIVGVVAARGATFEGIPLLQGYILHIAALSIICAISMALSTRMNVDAAITFSFALTAGCFLIIPRVPELIVHDEGIRETALLVLYAAMPHFELFDMRQRMIHGGGPVAWRPMLEILAYGLVMTATFLVLAWIGYRRKRFSRGAAL
jgi:ABC-type transport system involved in multi-copper enzyme maturation permease subunit